MSRYNSARSVLQNMNELKILAKDIIDNQSLPDYSKSMVKESNDPYGN